MNTLRLLSICSGIGGADLAAEWTGGIEVVGQVEIDPFCRAVLSKHWPHVKRLHDIKEVQGDEFGNIDLVVAGIPCQPFSNAGKQRGTADDRYLWPELFRIVRRCQPRWVVIENVDDFTYLALDIVQADLESESYAVQAFVLPACAVDAPHIRERCFVVAHSDRFRECRQTSNSTNRQRSALEPASVCQWEDRAAHVADASCQRSSSKWNGGNARTYDAACACSEDVADSEYGRRQRGSEYEEPSGTVVLCGSSTTGISPQSRMGRVFDGGSARLDSMCWPSPPGQGQQEWEPSRTITGRYRARSQRLRALGNAIVPQQIYPIFQGIVEWERA
ncbi:DNA (cytosine-5-)-methyltransferase [Reticulibacter mediterranei]|uniref:DNA (cytosine-5-)-methyltransferase n=1 Tax=Reticulibacter mediterranei TaxID=2778369 RepID=UPI001C6897B0